MMLPSGCKRPPPESELSGDDDPLSPLVVPGSVKRNKGPSL